MERLKRENNKEIPNKIQPCIFHDGEFVSNTLYVCPVIFNTCSLVFVSTLEFMSVILNGRSRVKIKFMKMNYDRATAACRRS
jgi:hypothetical protein